MMRCLRRALLFALLLLIGCGTACSKRSRAPDTSVGTIQPVPHARAEGGWPLYEVPAEGFALALPPDWRQIDMNPATFEAKFQETLKQNPQFEALHANLRQQVMAGTRFVGFDEATIQTGFATNVNVLRLPLPPGGTLDTAAAQSLRDLEKVPNVTKPIAHERVKIATADSERFRYKVTAQVAPGQTQALSITQFLFVKGTNGYMVTLTTLSAREVHYAATFEKIGQSFRFLR
jgi:hypothetical protein